MDLYYELLLFFLGTLLGSFYTVVGERLPNGESIISPPSHCPNCKHRLRIIELIPIFSFLILGGKCYKCKSTIPVLSTLIELLTGCLFAIAYLKFGLTVNLLIALLFISMLVIIIVSDIRYMIICDEVLIFFNLCIIICMLFNIGIEKTCYGILIGASSFAIMFMIKMFGDLIFKRESMGGGDIKLMFTFGLVMGIVNSISSIFLASFIGLPISLILVKDKKNHEIPFGPYLAIAALILYLSGINVIDIITRV